MKKEIEQLHDALIEKAKNNGLIHLPIAATQPPDYHLLDRVSPGMVIMNNFGWGLVAFAVPVMFLSEVEGALEVPDNSMEPTLVKGSYIGISRIPDGQEPAWGLPHLILFPDGDRIVRRTYQHTPDTIRLVADNVDEKKFPPLVKKRTGVSSILSVKVIITTL